MKIEHLKMKFFLNHTIILILAVSCCSNLFAATDSLPPCVGPVLQVEPRIVTQYNYKGQQLYSYKTTNQTRPQNASDQMTTIRFYDSNCQLVFTWTRGGIAGLNKLTPDSIQKEKIITIRTDTLDTLVAKKLQPLTNLPDGIAKLAIQKKSYWIEENNYKGNYIYRFQNPADTASTSKVIFVGSWYDEKGKAIPVSPSGKTWWWHYVSGKYSRTPFRPGYR